jgi:hypothetical protein
VVVDATDDRANAFYRHFDFNFDELDDQRLWRRLADVARCWRVDRGRPSPEAATNWPGRHQPGAGRSAWWAAVIQSAGTLFFNVTTSQAMHADNRRAEAGFAFPAVLQAAPREGLLSADIGETIGGRPGPCRNDQRGSVR